MWKMTADEDVMMATAGLFLEVQKGDSVDLSKVNKLLQQGADLMAANGEGCTALLAAVETSAPLEVVNTLLENGACPDVSSRDGTTPLQLVMRKQTSGDGDAAWLAAVAEALRKHGAMVPESDKGVDEMIEKLRETFGLKMVASLLTLQSAPALPVEVLEVMHLLLRELPLRVVKQALEPQAFRALSALLQHFVGGTDSLSTAVIGCRLMRALHMRNDQTLRYLVTCHGALRWSKRLASTKDVAQCGLYRQPPHEKVTPEELCKEAKALHDELMSGRAGEGEAARGADEDWRQNTKLVEIATTFEACEADCQSPERLAAATEALLSTRELLKKTEKGAITEERVAAYELERSNMPGLLLRFLKHRAAVPAEGDAADAVRHPGMNAERWAAFRDAFGDSTKHARKGLGRLMKALHAVIETGEALPVWRHKKERGLRALTEPLALRPRRPPPL